MKMQNSRITAHRIKLVMDAAIINSKPFASLNIVWWHVLSLRVFRKEGRLNIVWWHVLSLRVFREEGRLNIVWWHV